VTKVKK
jgi:hypothetical protein